MTRPNRFEKLVPIALSALLIAGCVASSHDFGSKPKTAAQLADSMLAAQPDTIYDSGVHPSTKGFSKDPVNGVRVIEDSKTSMTVEIGWNKDGEVRFSMQDHTGKEIKVFTEGSHDRGEMRFHLLKERYLPGDYYFLLATQGHVWKTKLTIAP